MIWNSRINLAFDRMDPDRRLLIVMGALLVLLACPALLAIVAAYPDPALATTYGRFAGIASSLLLLPLVFSRVLYLRYP